MCVYGGRLKMKSLWFMFKQQWRRRLYFCNLRCKGRKGPLLWMSVLCMICMLVLHAHLNVTPLPRVSMSHYISNNL